MMYRFTNNRKINELKQNIRKEIITQNHYNAIEKCTPFIHIFNDIVQNYPKRKIVLGMKDGNYDIEVVRFVRKCKTDLSINYKQYIIKRTNETFLFEKIEDASTKKEFRNLWKEQKNFLDAVHVNAYPYDEILYLRFKNEFHFEESFEDIEESKMKKYAEQFFGLYTYIHNDFVWNFEI